MPRLITPTASGFGKNVRGGWDGEVLFINDISEATSISAWNKSNARIIIPRVSGYVELTSNLRPSYSGRSNFTYLGMFAPGELVYKNWEVRISDVSNFALFDLKSRPGDRNKEISTVSGDAFTLATFTGGVGCEGFFISHCTGSWGSDEVMSLASAMEGTVEYCMFYEPLNFSTINEKNNLHGFGHIWGSKNVSFHHNFMGHYHQRMPLFQNNRELIGVLDMRNNLGYNWFQSAATTSGACKSVNFIKNSFWQKQFFTGVTPNALMRFSTHPYQAVASETTVPRIYMFGNKLKKWNGTAYVDLVPSLTDDATSQRLQLNGFTGNITTGYRDIVGVLEPFELPVGLYNFDETPEQSDLKIIAKAGTRNRDLIDKRIIEDFQTGQMMTGGRFYTLNGVQIGGLIGVIDQPEDSTWFGFPRDSSNVNQRGYPEIPAREQVLNGVAPHYLPDWYIEKYGLTNFANYHLAGTPQVRPENYLIFGKGDIGIQLSQYGGAVDYENDLIYRGYEALAFHITGEIGLLETPSYDLTVTVVGNGITNIQLGSFAANNNVQLIATAASQNVFVRWEQFNIISSEWESISVLSTFNFLMPSADTQVRAVFVSSEVIPPVEEGIRFCRIDEPIV